MSGPKSATVHDLGYRRYEGPRRPQAVRLGVIARNLIAMAWRGWWRMKLWVIASAMLAVVFAGAIYVMLFLTKNPLVRGALGGGGAPLRRSDFMLPSAFDPLTGIAFILGLSVIANVVANDTRVGAFEFYFSRPLRARDYIFGKLLGAGTVVATILVGAPLIIAITRIALAGGASDVAGSLHLLPRTIAAGLIATVAYTAVPLAVSSLGTRKAFTIAGWAIIYLVVGYACVGIAYNTGVRELSALSIKQSVMSITFALFDIERVGRDHNVLPPVGAACAAVIAYTALAIGVLFWRVRRAEHAGMGGG